MPHVTVKTKRVGGSLMVTLPKDLVNLLGLEEGEPVDLDVSRPRQNYLGVLRGIGRFTEADRADHG